MTPRVVDHATVVRDPREAYQVLRDDEEVAYDIETSGLSPWRDRIQVLTALGEASNRMVVLQVHGVVPDEMKEVFSDPRRRLTAHNATGFDTHFMLTHGVDVYQPRWWDTMIAEGVIAVSGRRDVSMSLRATLSRRAKLTIEKDADHAGWSTRDDLTADQLRYVVDDVKALHDLRHVQFEKATQSGDIGAVEFEMDLAKLVVRMTQRGLPIDVPKLLDFLEGQAQLQAESQPVVDRIAGFAMNTGSHVQVLRAFQSLGVRLPSTGVEILADLTDREDDAGELARRVLAIRRAKQRRNMYDADWVRQYVIDGPHGPTVHSRYWQVGTDTNRFSSSDPNLQQVPVNMRQVFGGWDGFEVVKSDYAALEVRAAAHLYKDTALRKIFDDRIDPHSGVGAAIFQCTPDEVSKEQRKQAKAGNFTLLFGGGWRTFHEYAHRSGSELTAEEAEAFFNRYMATFRGVQQTRQRAYQIARSGGPVVIRLPTGIRRVLVGRMLTPTRVLNTTVQGSAACGMKFAIVECGRRGIDRYLSATVHDELVGTPPTDEAEDFSHELEEAMIVGMQRAFPDFPIECEVKRGSHWQS